VAAVGLSAPRGSMGTEGLGHCRWDTYHLILLQCLVHPPEQPCFGGGIWQPSSGWTSEGCSPPRGPLCSRAGTGRECSNPSATAECPKVRYLPVPQGDSLWSSPLPGWSIFTVVHVCLSCPVMPHSCLSGFVSDMSCSAPILVVELAVPVIFCAGSALPLSVIVADQESQHFAGTLAGQTSSMRTNLATNSWLLNQCQAGRLQHQALSSAWGGGKM
jgi:hypothetical protein